jgi:NADH-quinone oxidoreductase subunit C
MADTSQPLAVTSMMSPSVLDVLRQVVPDGNFEETTATDMPTVYVDREHIADVLRALNHHPDLQFSLLSDLTAADYWPVEPRFEVVYLLACLGPSYHSGKPAPARRLRLKVRVPGADARIATASAIYPAANWPEREVFDLFGIVFENHADLRRILMPEDWEGYPLRRDYPVQIRKVAEGWAPIQVTAEEFAANVRAQHDQATRVAKGQEAPPPATDHGVRPAR